MSVQSYVDPSGIASVAEYDYYEELYDPDKASADASGAVTYAGPSSNATASGTNATVYYTYATAGYLNQNEEATLVTITDSTINLTRYNAGGTASGLTTVARVVTETAAPTLSSVAVTTAPTKTEYVVGETLDTTGMVVTATYSDGTSAAVTGYTVSYEGMTASFEITVSAAKEVSYINITEGTTVYTVGDKLTFTVFVYYKDGTSAYVDQDACEIACSCTSHASCGSVENMMNTVALGNDGYYTFTTSHFSIFVVGNTDEEDEKDLTRGSNEEKTVYVLVSTPTAGNQYIIASSGSAGNAYALKENTTTGTSITINAATDSITAPYIETSDSTIMWSAASGMTFRSQNGNYYLRQTESKGNRSLSFSTSESTNWTVGTNSLSYKGSKSTYYVSGGSNWSLSSSSANVYFYEKQTVDSSATYTVSSSSIEHIYSDDDPTDDTETIAAAVLADGSDVTSELGSDGSFSYALVSDPNGIIDTEKTTDGTICFTGKEGTAKVRVYYTYGECKIWTTIDVSASYPYLYG